MIAVLRILMILGGIAGGAMLLVQKVAGVGKTVKGVNQQHLAWLKEVLHGSKVDLVKLNSEEIGLLSLSQIKSSVKKGSFKIMTGVFKSVYNEDLMEYAMMKYEQNQSLIVVQTKQLELVYRIFENLTDIYVNGNFLGKLNKEGKLYDPLNSTILASIDPSEEARLLEIRKQAKSLGSVLNPLSEHGTIERVLPIYEYNSHDEKVLLLSLTFLNMIQRS